jgi:hypothetical protein
MDRRVELLHLMLHLFAFRISRVPDGASRPAIRMCASKPAAAVRYRTPSVITSGPGVNGGWIDDKLGAIRIAGWSGVASGNLAAAKDKWRLNWLIDRGCCCSAWQRRR